MRPPGVRGLLAADARQRGRRPAARVEHCRPQRFALPAPARRAGDRPDVCRRGVRPPVRGIADHGPQPAERRGGYRRPAGRHRTAGHRRTALRPAGRTVRCLCQSRDRAAYGACGSRPGGVPFGPGPLRRCGAAAADRDPLPRQPLHPPQGGHTGLYGRHLPARGGSPGRHPLHRPHGRGASLAGCGGQSSSPISPRITTEAQPMPNSGGM